MSGAKSVRKGKRYERRVAVALREVFPNAGRSLQYQKAHGAPDVRAGPLWVEVKGHQVAAVGTWRRAEKAMRDAGAGRDVAAVVQPSGTTGPLLVTLPLRDLIRMLGDAAWGELAGAKRFPVPAPSPASAKKAQGLGDRCGACVSGQSPCTLRLDHSGECQRAHG